MKKISIDSRLKRAAKLAIAGDTHQAIAVYQGILGEYPGNRRAKEAKANLEKNLAEVLDERLIKLYEQKDFSQLRQKLKEVLGISPRSPLMWNLLGVVERDEGNLHEAKTAFTRAVELREDFAIGFNNLGLVLLDLGEIKDAAGSFKRAISADTGFADGYNNLGFTHKKLGEFDLAVKSYRRAVKINPGNHLAWNNLGALQTLLGFYNDAIMCYQSALGLDRQNYQYHNGLGAALMRSGDLKESERCFRRAVELNPKEADALVNLAHAQQLQGKFEEAQNHCLRAVQIEPQNNLARLRLEIINKNVCDWHRSPLDDALLSGVGQESLPISPWEMLPFNDNPKQRLQQSINWAERLTLTSTRIDHQSAQSPKINQRIVVAYVGSDFFDHATMYLAAGIFRNHDQTRFRIIILNYGRENMGSYRRLLNETATVFNVRSLSDSEIVELARREQIDIAIDMKGYTQNARFSLFIKRLAPVQVSFLGYPGSSGSTAIDYLIADKITIPEEERGFYSETIIYMPGSYQPNDDMKTVPQAIDAKSDHGLPEHGFVFCSFNQPYKLNPADFDAWTALMREVPNSVLWLLETSKLQTANLVKYAKQKGISGDRLVFAKPLPHLDHLARLAHADLFLDSLTCNGHTTTSDALISGIPVVTVAGRQFAARVSASLLHASGLSRFVAIDIADYKFIALELASNPETLREAKSAFSEQKAQSPLFDSRLFTRNIEAAFVQINQVAKRQLSARDIEIK